MSTPDTNGWYPIESAPKDGTFIITCRDFWRPAIVHWATYAGVSRWGPDPETFMEEDHFLQWWTEIQYEPTHYQPLPKPPGVSS